MSITNNVIELIEKYVPSLIHLVNVPDVNMHAAIPKLDTITNGRRLNLFKSHAFNNDMAKRVTPTKIEDVYALIFVPTS